MVKKIFIILILLPIVLWAFWFIIPESFIQSRIENSVSNDKLILEAKGLKKGFFYLLVVDNLVLKNFQKELITVNNIKSHINPFYLLIFRLKGSFDGGVGESGSISGYMNLTKKRIVSEIDFTGVNISEIPLFKLFGIKGDGIFSGTISIKENTGYIRFYTENTKLEPFSFSKFRVPINFFQKIMGSVEINKDIINIVSFTLEGRDIYARARGIVKNNVLDASIELMPGKSYVENPLFIYELERYKVSPGYYVIPIHTNLEF